MVVQLLEAVSPRCGRAIHWWVWWSECHPEATWETFTTAFLRLFKPKWRHLITVNGLKDIVS